MSNYQTFEDYILAESRAKRDPDYIYTPLDMTAFWNRKPLPSGNLIVGHTWTGPEKKMKGANILQHGKTGKFFAATGANTGILKNSTFHDSAEEAAEFYHKPQTEAETKS